MPSAGVLMLLQPHFCRCEEKVEFQDAEPETDSFPAKTEVKLQQLVSAEKIGPKPFTSIFEISSYSPRNVFMGEYG